MLAHPKAFATALVLSSLVGCAKDTNCRRIPKDSDLPLRTICLDESDEPDGPVSCDALVSAAGRPVAADAGTYFGRPDEVARHIAAKDDVALEYTGISAPTMSTRARVQVIADPELASVVSTGSLFWCWSHLEFDAVMKLESDDGAFREEISGTLRYTRNGISDFRAFVAASALQGRYAEQGFSEGAALVVTMTLPKTEEDDSLQDLRIAWRGNIVMNYSEDATPRSLQIASWK